MAWFLLARVLFLAAVTARGDFLRPLEAPVVFNAGFGLLLGALVVAFEWRMRDLSVTHMLGAVLRSGARARTGADAGRRTLLDQPGPSRASPSCMHWRCWR